MTIDWSWVRVNLIPGGSSRERSRTRAFTASMTFTVLASEDFTTWRVRARSSSRRETEVASCRPSSARPTARRGMGTPFTIFTTTSSMSATLSNKVRVRMGVWDRESRRVPPATSRFCRLMASWTSCTATP